VSEQKIEQFWRPATADDVARVMGGQSVEARFRDSEKTSWFLRKLVGFNSSGFFCNHMECWKQCQVYDPPAILKNKPDPGEGWRLLEKFPHEAKLEHDEEWDANEKHWKWNPGISCTPAQVETLWYRRRIETNNPTSSDGCRSRDTIPSGWRVLGKNEERLASDAYWSLGCKEWVVLGDDRVCDANSQQWHAIRQVDYQADYALLVGFTYPLPNGWKICVTAKGFEVL
jgi:uncharacterized protein YbdZ (MbtH family)